MLKLWLKLRIRYPDIVDPKSGIHSADPRVNKELLEKIEEYYTYLPEKQTYVLSIKER